MSNAWIVSAARTPIGRYGGALAAVRPDDLAAQLLRRVAADVALDPETLDDVVLGCANQAGEDNRNVARMALLLAGLPVEVPGVTVNRLCGSGHGGRRSRRRAPIRAGEGDLVHRRRRREHDARAVRHAQAPRARSRATSRSTTRRSAGASSTRR